MTDGAGWSLRICAVTSRRVRCRWSGAPLPSNALLATQRDLA